MNKTLALSLVLIAASFAFSYYAFGLLPDEIATHWNLAGEADGFSGKEYVFLTPILSLIVLGLLWFLPSIDPLKKNIQSFRNYYDLLVLFLTAFFLYLNIATTGVNLGWFTGLTNYMTIGIGALFVFLGWFLPKTKRSWFIGIRTPWTLSSDVVWKKTQVVGGYVYASIGVLMILLPSYLMTWIILAIVMSIGLFAYSYLISRKN
ncbi:SdpI family protein [Candidatus Micrarchaeota archaeon]|nr:SdpI family protein [Candidatus Micrarchaeota archaeon]